MVFKESARRSVVMLSSYFAIEKKSSNEPANHSGFKKKNLDKKKPAKPKAPAPKAPAPRHQQEPWPSESSTTTLYAPFKALPPESNIPQAYTGRENAFFYNSDDDDENFLQDEETDKVTSMEGAEGDDEGQGDAVEYDDESKESEGGSDVSQSFDDTAKLFKHRPRQFTAAVYAGPQLYADDDDFID
jgi:hypothetical protein